MHTVFVLKGKKYNSTYELRNAIPEIAFPSVLTEEVMAMLGISTEEVEDETDTLEFQKNKKLEQLNYWFERQRAGKSVIKSELGFDIDANERAFNDVNGLMIIHQDGGEKVDFMDAHNKIQTLNVSELAVVQKEIARNLASIYNDKWKKRKAITNAKTVPEVRAINIFEGRDE